MLNDEAGTRLIKPLTNRFRNFITHYLLRFIKNYEVHKYKNKVKLMLINVF